MRRLTRQRNAVFSAFSDTGRVLTAPEILAHAREIVPEISLSTVYRQVSLLLADGEIAKVELPGEPARCEVACKGDGHAQHDGHGDAARLVRVMRRRGPQRSRTQGALTSTPAAAGCRSACRCY